MKFSLNTDPTGTVRHMCSRQPESIHVCGLGLPCSFYPDINSKTQDGILKGRLFVWLILLLIISIFPAHAQTPTLGDYHSVNSGNWSDLVNWERFNGTSWQMPTATEGYPGQLAGTDDVWIRDDHTITIDVSPAESISGLYVGQGNSGVLQYDALTAHTLWVSGIVTINRNAVFRSALTGTVTTHQLIVEAGIVNAGTLDFSTNTAGAGITFTGNSSGLFDLSNATRTNLMASNGLVLNKGTGVLSFTPGGTLQVRSGNAEGFLTIQSGTFSLLGQNSFSNPLFYASSGSYTIPAGGGFRLDNSNAVVTSLFGTLTNNGELTISRGEFNLGNGTGNELLITSTGSFDMSGGTMNISGRFRMEGGNAVISGGTINLARVGHANQTRAAFHIFESASLSISGNTLITLGYPNSSTETHYNDIEIVAGAGIKAISGGTFQMGTGNYTITRTFLINSDIPVYNLMINNAYTRVSLTKDLTISNLLTLNGRLLMNNYNLTLGTPAIAGDLRASHGMILTGTGQIYKNINSTGSCLFPFGNSSNAYLPVTLNFTGGNFMSGATVSVGMTPTIHPQNVNTTNYLKRYWTVQTNGINNPVYDFTGTYSTNDVEGSSDAWITTGVYTTATGWRRLSASGNVGTTIHASGLTENVAITGINSAAAAAVTVTPATATICSGSSVQLTATATGDAPFTYSWTPTAGLSAANISNPLASPTATVTYTVTVTDGMGSMATANATVTVNPQLPVSVVIASSDADNIICAGESVTFTATPTNAGTAPSYQWYVGTTPVGTNSPTYTTTTLTSGQAVSVVVTSNALCVTGSPATSNAITTTVNPVLPVGVSITASANPVCAGTSVTFTATPVSNDVSLVYQWQVNGNNVGGNNATYSYTPSDEDIVTCVLTSNAPCATGSPATSNAVTMTVNPMPTATISGTTDVCQNATSPTITFTGASGTPPYTFTYSMNNGASQTITSTGNMATLTVPTGTPGEFMYSLLSVQDAHCTQLQTGTATVTVHPLPTVTVSSNSPQCVGSTLGLSASGGTSYSWSGPNGYTSTQQNPSIANVTAAAAGIYTVTVTDANGCLASASTTVTINPAPTVSITANPGNTICSGTNVTFTTRVNNAGDNPTYQWRINGEDVSGATGSSFSTTTLANAQQVTVVITADPAYCSSTATSNMITMTVNAPVIPTVTVLESGNNICAGTTVNFSTIVVNGGTSPAYQWQINEVDVPGATASSFSSGTLNNGDRVRVIVTSNASCVSPSTAQSGPITMLVNPLLTPSVSITANPTTAVCPGTAITFTATPVNGGSSPTYQWQVNGSPVGTNSATFTSSTLANNDVVSVRMTSNASCVTQAIAQSNNLPVGIHPGAPAIPAAITGNVLACPNGTETYTIAQVLNASAYNWTVPTGWSIVTGQGSNSITVTTGTTGQNGSITVTASNTCGTSGVRTLAVSVGTPSTAPTGITITNNNTCFGTGKTLTVTGGSLGTGAQWQWFTGSCEGTLVGTGASLTVNPSSGSTIYYVRASGNCNTTVCAEGTVIVSPGAPAQPQAISGGANPVCPGANLTYSIPAVVNATSYNWTAPAGWTITNGQGTTSVTVTSGTAGQNGNISVMAVNSCGNSTPSSLAVIVSPGAPATPGVIAGVSDQCINSSNLVYSVAPVANATSYSWTVPTGWTITAGSVTNSITVSTNGTASNGNITVIANNSCGSSMASVMAVNVVTAVPPTPGTISGLTAICPVKSVVYSITPVQGAISYTWTVPTNWSISSGQGTASITVQVPSNAASGNVSVRANNVCGSSAASILAVSVANTAWVNAGADQVVCQGTASVTLNGSVGGAIKANQTSEWDWVVSTGTINNQNSLSSTFTLPNNGNTPGIYTVRIRSNVNAVGCTQTEDEMTVTVLPNPTASLSITGNNPICFGSSSIVTFTGTPNTTVTYTVSGITGSSTINIGASGTASLTTPTLIANTTYTLTNIAYTAGPVCARTITGSATITVNPVATINAGQDLTICAGNNAPMSGSLGGSATSGTWTTSGTGSFSNNTPTAVYTPGAADILAGAVTLTYTSDDPSGPCGPVSDAMVLTINPVPIINAGADQTICAGSTATMSGMFGGNATSGTWTTSGTGSFSNNTPTAVYTPSPADIIAGMVTLIYTTNDPSGPCGPVSDAMVLTINPVATINAGADQTICASSAVALTGSVGGGASSATWSGGSGSLSNPGSLITTYTPSAEEIADRTVTLTLTSNDPDGPCGPVSDQVTITITPLASVNAGVDQDICAGSSIILSGTIGGAATSATWTTSGSGTFSPNNTALNATYLPGAGETGDITLTLTTNNPDGSCDAVSDQMILHIYPSAIVDAGPDQTICSNGTAQLSASVGGSATSGIWTTSGGGTFNDPTSPMAVYTPGNSDLFNGTVTLTFTTNDPEGPCSPVSDAMTLTISDAIQITSQPANTGVCATYPADLSVQAIGDNLTYQWYRGTAPGGTAVVNSTNITGAQSASLHFNHATSVDEGSYYLLITGAVNCTTLTSAVVTLNVDQEITITTPLEANSVCVGEDVTFRIVAEPGGLLTFQWRKDGVILPGETGNTLTLTNVTLANGGSYDVLIAGMEGYTCSSAQSAAATLTVTEDATIVLSSAAESDNQTICTNTPLNTITYTIGGGGTNASITNGSLPDGVNGAYNPLTREFVISGTPTVANEYNYTITVTGNCEDATMTGSITVQENSTMALTSAAATASQSVCINTPITPITYSIGGSATGATFTGLPDGVNGSVSGGIITISGTPTVVNTFNYTVTTTGPCANQSLGGTITVRPNSTITLSSANNNPTVCINTAIANILYSIGGSATGATVTGLPNGMTGTFNGGSFTISGAPTEAGSFNYTVTTTGSCENTSLGGTITVHPNSTITLSSGNNNQTVCINTAIANISYTIGEGGTGATVTGLPAGLSSTFNGGVFTISGIPAVAGTYPFTVTATGSSCINPSLGGTITVNNVGTISLASGNTNQAICINTPITGIRFAVGGSATGVTAANLPPGVTGSYNAGVYLLTGTPTAPGDFNFTLTTTGDCASGSISGFIQVSPVSVGGSLAPYNQTVCTTTNSGSLTLSGETGTILRWESSTNAGISWTSIPNTSNTYNFSNLPVTTIFRAVVKSGACPEVYSAPARVVVIPFFEPVITATTVDICNGNSTRLSVSTSLLQPVGAFTGGGFNEANPAGWRVSQNGSVISPFPAAGDNRAVGPWAETNGPRTFNGVSYDTQDNTKFTIVNGPVNSTLETPVFNLFGLPSAELTFRETHNLAPGATARVELSTDGGNSYNIVLATYTGSTGGIIDNPVNIDMSPYLGMMNLRIRFNYSSPGPGGWALDGVSIPSQQTDVTYFWSPAETLSSTTDSVVIATPGVTTEYTLTMMVSGCPVIAKSIVIGVANPPVVQTTNACIGAGPVTFTQTGGTVGGTWRVSGGGTINAATGVFTPAMPGCFNASYLTPSGTCGDTVSFVVFPAAPTPIINAGCGPIVVTPPAAIPGFTLQYSFDNGVTWGGNTPPTAENCAGYQIRTRYITTQSCDHVAQGSTSTIAGCDMSPAVSRVVDLTAPAITCPANVTVNTNADACFATLVLTPPVVTDNCTAASAILVTSNAPAQFPVGETIVTWTAVDACGNQSTCTQTVTVTDNSQAPVFTTCPDDQVQTASPNNCILYDIVLTEPVAADNCAVTRITYSTTGATTLTSPQEGLNYVSGQDLNVGLTTITYIAYDAAGNASQPCSFTVTILDVTPPNLTISGCVDVEESAAANNCSKIPVTIIDPTYSDDCWPIDSLTLSWTMSGATTGSGIGSVVGQTFNVGVTTVIYQVEDPDGNTATCSFNVTILDVTPPNLTIGGCVNVEESTTADNCSKIPVNIIDPTYSDNCWPIDSLTLSWTMSGATTGSGTGSVVGQTFNIGVTTVIYEVEDPDGNRATCSFNVTILRLDIPEASITCPDSPAPVTAVAGTCSAPVIVESPVEVDPCQTVTYTFINDFNGTDDASDDYPVGTTIVTWTITDNSGRTMTCEQTVVVNDLPPTIACPGPVIVQADFELPYQDAVIVPGPTYNDNCPNPVLTWTMVPPVGYASQYAPGALSGTGNYPSPSQFYLGVTTITYTVTDSQGATATCSFTVTVLAEPEITCLPEVTYDMDPGLCTATRNSDAYGLPTLVTGLQPITWTWTITNPDGTPGTTGSFIGSSETPGPPAIPDYAFRQGTSTITWRAENVSGYDECTQTVTVTDNQSPTFTVPEALTECVESLSYAVYDPATIDINPERPDYYILEPGVLDITGLTDNCCAVGEMTIHWRIDLSNGSSIAGTGQPSAYGSEIRLPGDVAPYDDILVHLISFWVEDCHGNTSPEQTQNIFIQPRPNLTKGN